MSAAADDLPMATAADDIPVHKEPQKEKAAAAAHPDEREFMHGMHTHGSFFCNCNWFQH